MPTSIPYDPSLVLGNIVPQKKLDQLLKIGAAQAPIDTAQEQLDNLISLKYSLDMTRNELMDMYVDPTDLEKEIAEVGKQISAAATAYASASIKGNKAITQLKDQDIKSDVSEGNKVAYSPESPLNYNRTIIKQMPLSSDSLKMDSQYFSFDENSQSSASTMAAIKSFVSESTTFTTITGKKGNSIQLANSAVDQINKQRELHSIVGTLIISVNCTHKQSSVFAPLVLDVDKAIRVWNNMFTNDKDKIKTNSIADMQKIANEQQTDKEPFFNIISGATYGSSFVGMVHVLNTTSTESSQTMMSVAASLQDQFTVGSFFEDASGGFGVNSSFSQEAKNLLSQQNISSHISVVSMGCIPSIVSNEVELGVKAFSNFDPKDTMDNLASLANATSEDKGTVDAAAEAARTGARMMAMQNSTVTSVMSGLAKIEDGKNKMLDINSLMDAFQDFVTKALDGSSGVPINYYLKPITRSQLAQMWIQKYYPNKFLTLTTGDDTTPPPGQNKANVDEGAPAEE